MKDFIKKRNQNKGNSNLEDEYKNKDKCRHEYPGQNNDPINKENPRIKSSKTSTPDKSANCLSSTLKVNKLGIGSIIECPS